MPRNLAVGVLRGVGKVPKGGQHSKYGTKPRPGRRQSKNITTLGSTSKVSTGIVVSARPVLTKAKSVPAQAEPVLTQAELVQTQTEPELQAQPVLTKTSPDRGAGQQSAE